jgi:hypothetical protein
MGVSLDRLAKDLIELCARLGEGRQAVQRIAEGRSVGQQGLRPRQEDDVLAGPVDGAPGGANAFDRQCLVERAEPVGTPSPIDKPATLVSMASRTFAASGATAKPDPKSALTGRSTAAFKAARCARTSSRESVEPGRPFAARVR